MTPPTKEQARTLEAIRALSVDGVSPSYRELMAELGHKSVSRIHVLLSGLKDRGLVAFDYNRPRSMRIIEPVQAIDLKALSKEQLTTLRTRIETELVGRWKL